MSRKFSILIVVVVGMFALSSCEEAGLSANRLDSRLYGIWTELGNTTSKSDVAAVYERYTFHTDGTGYFEEFSGDTLSKHLFENEFSWTTMDGVIFFSYQDGDIDKRTYVLVADGNLILDSATSDETEFGDDDAADDNVVIGKEKS